MAIWVIDPDVRLEFRRRHRRQVQIDRAKKRRFQAEKPRNNYPNSLDKDWHRAVENDRS